MNFFHSQWHVITVVIIQVLFTNILPLLLVASENLKVLTTLCTLDAGHEGIELELT